MTQQREIFLRGKWRVLIVVLWISCAVQDNYLDQGLRYIDAGEWDQAVQFYQEAIQRHPDKTEVKMMLKNARWHASKHHSAKGEAFMKGDQYNEAIGEFQMALAMDPFNRKAAENVGKAKNKRQASALVKQARNHLKSRQFQQARDALQKALAVDPENGDAQNLLAYYRRDAQDVAKYPVTLKNKAPISLKFKNTPIDSVFEVLSSLTGINFIFDNEIKEIPVTLFMTDVSFEKFLSVLLGTHNLAAKVMDEKTLVIYPTTPQKIKEYQDLQIRTFYLATLTAQQAQDMLSKTLKTENIIVNEKLNAVIVRAPREMIEVASRILAANDRPMAEVLLTVEILEVSRTKEQQLGLELNPTSITLGIGGEAPDIGDDATFSERASLSALAGLSSKELMLSVPTATINFLKQDGDTRILANPQIRVRNGASSRVHIGERIPLRTNRRVETTGVVTFDFQYFDIGVKLSATPLVNMHGEISLDLNLEISTLGPNLGTSDDPQYSILTRTAQSILTVFDGEGVIIGGLISDEERTSKRTVPYIGDIPVVGRVFSSDNYDDRRTDILMAITPLVIRHQDVPDIDIAETWSGKEENFSTEEPFESLAEKKRMYLNQPKEKIPEPKPPVNLKHLKVH